MVLVTGLFVGLVAVLAPGSGRAEVDQPDTMPAVERPTPAEPATVSGQGAASHFVAEDAGAVFMVGMVFGMTAGIALFFLHLRRREARMARFADDDLMLDNWPVARPAVNDRSARTGQERHEGEEVIEQREPWERSVDWWKNPDQS